MVFSVYLPSDKLSCKRELRAGIFLVMPILAETNFLQNIDFSQCAFNRIWKSMAPMLRPSLSHLCAARLIRLNTPYKIWNLFSKTWYESPWHESPFRAPLMSDKMGCHATGDLKAEILQGIYANLGRACGTWSRNRKERTSWNRDGQQGYSSE